MNEKTKSLTLNVQYNGVSNSWYMRASVDESWRHLVNIKSTCSRCADRITVVVTASAAAADWSQNINSVMCRTLTVTAD